MSTYAKQQRGARGRSRAHAHERRSGDTREHRRNKIAVGPLHTDRHTRAQVVGGALVVIEREYDRVSESAVRACGSAGNAQRNKDTCVCLRQRRGKRNKPARQAYPGSFTWNTPLVSRLDLSLFGCLRTHASLQSGHEKARGSGGVEVWLCLYGCGGSRALSLYRSSRSTFRWGHPVLVPRLKHARTTYSTALPKVDALDASLFPHASPDSYFYTLLHVGFVRFV